LPSYNENDRIAFISRPHGYHDASLTDVTPSRHKKNEPCRMVQDYNTGFIHLSVESLQKLSFNE